MGDPHDLISELYNEEKIHLYWLLLEISDFVTVSLNLSFKFLFDVFSPWLEVWNGASTVSHFINCISKLCSVWFLFKIKLPRSELNTRVGSFWTHVPPSPTKKCAYVCVGGPLLAPLMVEVMPTQTFKTFKTRQTDHYLSFLILG